MSAKRVVGITGGVGAGKSTVLALLQEGWGACIIQADTVARELMEPGGSCFRAVTEAFGENILGPDGAIDRGALAKIVFHSEARRQELNALTHPRVFGKVRARIAAAEETLVVYETALPEEARLRELCGEIWYIYAPEEVRIRRLMASRGYSREKCLDVMRSQKSEELFRRLADRVIENRGTPEETRKQLQTALGFDML
ncbi:MAG: dephospho-CoA kinase [Lachnospiraceae bacterium]|nr:dephospho-CoA kinase [Lachnospiraceae bacterium]